MWLRPSTAFYGNFSLDMDRSPGFGPACTDFSALLRLGFPPAPHLKCLTMPAHAARRTVLQKVRGRAHGTPTVCGHRVSGSLSLPSRGSFHLSFTVLCSIGHQSVFRVTGWSPLVPPGFLVSRRTLDPAAPLSPSPTGLSPSPAGFPKTFLLGSAVTSAVRTPECTHSGLPSFHFARRYSGNRSFFLFLALLGCFGSGGSPPCVMDSRTDGRSPSGRVSPFRHPRIHGYLHLPAAFRSLSRLSSAPGAKASALCPFCLIVRPPP